MENTKKVLFLVETDHRIELFLKKKPNINPENILIIQTYGQEITSFSDIMRDIILAVYLENVEEIYVADTKENPDNKGKISNIFYENNRLQEKIKTLDYLFTNCRPELSYGNIRDWLENDKKQHSGVQSTIDMIQNHPLMPVNVKVKEFVINKGKNDPSELYQKTSYSLQEVEYQQ